MKKFLTLFAVAALTLASCSKEEESVADRIPNARKVTIGASYDSDLATKSTLDPNDGTFFWSEGDQISVRATGGTFWDLPLVDGAESTLGRFSGTISGDLNKVALFPHTLAATNPVSNGNQLTITLPTTINWVDGQVNNYMLAYEEELSPSSNVNFRNIGGLFKVTLNNVPVEATKLVFSADKRITGAFTIPDITAVPNENVEGSDYPKIETDGGTTNKTVTLNFDPVQQSNTTMVFYVPVPVGSYKIGFDVQDADDNSLWKFNGKSPNNVRRAHVVRMPALTLVSIGGGVEDSEHTIVLASGYDGTLKLPLTTHNIWVKVRPTGGTVNIQYGDGATDAQKPANVYIQALGEVGTLNVNLPASHVELTGASGENPTTIENVSSHTSVSTMVIDNTVVIADKVTVTGGSLDLSANVGGTLEVAIPEETVNATEEKVSININSAISNLEVNRAATQESQDKVYVSIGASAEVTIATLSVPETNCNLYVAPGATVTTVSTKAVETTISGTVGTLTASGQGTTVLVEKKGSITTEINSTDNAAIIIENRTTEEVAEKTAGSIVDNQNKEEGGTIETVSGEVVAFIGSTYYSTLTDAFAAAETGNTVRLAKDYNATSETMYDAHRNLGIDKGIIFEGDGHTLTVKGRGIAVGAGASSNIDVTFRDITIKNSTDAARCIDTRGHIGTLTLDKAKLDTQGASGAYTQPLTIGGNQSEKANVVIKNGSVIQTNDDATAYYAIITFNPVNMTITESTVTGWAAIYMKGEVSSEGSHGSTVNIDKSTINARNVYLGYSNAFAAFALEDGDITINITNSELNVHGDSNEQAIISFNNSNEIPNSSPNSVLNLGEGNTVNVTGEGLMQFDMDSTCALNITGGTFTIDPSAYVADGYQAVKSGNLWTVSKVIGVAAIGSTGYPTLAAAVEEVTNDQTITLLSDVTYDDGILYNKEGVSAKLNLNGKTLTVNTGSNANNRAIRIDNGTLEVYGGSIVAVGSGTNSSNGAGCYGAFRVEGNGVLNAHDLTLTNSRPWGLNVKVVGGVATLTNVTINSSYGGGIEVTETELGGHSKTGSATLTNCTFTQTGYFDHCSTTLSVSGGSELIINSGSYTSDNYAMYVFSSGGEITVNGGTFSGSYGNNDVAIIAAIDTNTYPEYTGGLQINGGTVNGGFAITSPAYMSITGGTYDHNPSAYVADGYAAVDNGDGTWTVQEFQGVAQIDSSYYATLEEAFAAVPAGTPTTITMIANAMINVAGSALTVPTNKDITLDLNGFQVVGAAETGSTSALITNNGTLTIIDSSDSNADGTGTGKLISGATPTWKWDGSDNFSGSYASNTITNCGTLTIKSGYLQNTSNGSATYAVDNNSGSRTATLNVNGGYLTAVNTVVRQFCNSTTNQNTVNITAGSIATSGYAGIWTQLPGNKGQEKLATLNVTGGTVSAASYAWYDYSFGDSFAAVNYAISGGTFTGWLYSYAVIGGVKPGFVTGGTFDHNPSAYVASGYTATQSGNVYTVGPAPVADYVFEDNVVTVYTAEGLSYVSLHYADFRDSEHNLSIKLAADLNMTGKEFSSFDVNNYTSSDKEIKLFTFDGQNHTLSGMTGMLISKSWAGLSAMDVKNLTIADSTIEKDVDDNPDPKYQVGVGAICGYAEASQYLRITNVHLINSTVRGGHWTGGLVGIAGGYDNANDGPVLEKIYVTNCSVEGCTIEGKGSNGALVGHAAMNPATLWEVTNFSVLNNSINNTGGKTDRTGALIGTLGWINEASSAFPEEKNKIWFTSPLVVTGNSVLGVANDAKKVGRPGTEGSPVYLNGENVIDTWL